MWTELLAAATLLMTAAGTLGGVLIGRRKTVAEAQSAVAETGQIIVRNAESIVAMQEEAMDRLRQELATERERALRVENEIRQENHELRAQLGEAKQAIYELRAFIEAQGLQPPELVL